MLKQIRLDTVTKIKNLFKSWVFGEPLVRKKRSTYANERVGAILQEYA